MCGQIVCCPAYKGVKALHFDPDCFQTGMSSIVWSSTTLVHTYISATIGWISIKFGPDVCDVQRMDSSDFNDPLTFPLVPP